MRESRRSDWRGRGGGTGRSQWTWPSPTYSGYEITDFYARRPSISTLHGKYHKSNCHNLDIAPPVCPEISRLDIYAISIFLSFVTLTLAVATEYKLLREGQSCKIVISQRVLARRIIFNRRLHRLLLFHVHKIYSLQIIACLVILCRVHRTVRFRQRTLRRTETL